MIERPLWLQRIFSSWNLAPIVWLSGVRRVGKSTLARAIPDADYINCDLPSAQQQLADPEQFYRSLSRPRLILDEVHQLPDPSRLLKIGADAFPHLRILATGSSTLAATGKFRDSLTGRKRNLHLIPVRHDELPAFGVTDLQHRLHRGGLPPALLSPHHDPGFYAEWLDSYYARDIQELFRVEKRAAFLKLVESVLRLSGGQIEATTLANLTGLSRPTVLNYLDVLEATHVTRTLRPWSGGSPRVCWGWDHQQTRVPPRHDTRPTSAGTLINTLHPPTAALPRRTPQNPNPTPSGVSASLRESFSVIQRHGYGFVRGQNRQTVGEPPRAPTGHPNPAQGIALGPPHPRTPKP